MNAIAATSNDFRLSGPGAAFTLIELLVLITILTLLVATLLPAMARSGPNAAAFRCLNNNRQLCAAWRMYAEDNGERLVPAEWDTAASKNSSWVASTIDFNSSNRANWDVDADITRRAFWPYTGRNAGFYRCPADQSYVVVDGFPKTRVRSMTMNIFLAGIDIASYSNYRVFFKLADLTAPGPANTFVFLDMRQDSIFWSDFFTDMTGYPNQPGLYTLQDLPNLIHNRGCSFSFADGRAEIHHWADARTTPKLIPGGYSTYISSPGNPDVAWLQDRATRPK